MLAARGSWRRPEETPAFCVFSLRSPAFGLLRSRVGMLGALFLENLNKMLGDLIPVPVFDLISRDKMHELAAFEQCDGG